MKKTFSKILGTHVISDQAEETISLITGIHIDPSNGKVIAIQCGFKNIISPIDIRKWGKALHIRDDHSLTTREGILRLCNIPKERERLLYKPVYTEFNEYIGKVYDYIIDTEQMILLQLIVMKKFLWITSFNAIIPKKEIIEITEKRIIIKDNISKEKIKLNAREMA